MSFAERAAALSKSATQAINDRAAELKRQGRDLIDLGAGEPRFAEPGSAQNAGKQAIEDGFTNYTEAGGTPELRSAILSRYERLYDLDPDGLRVIATTGAKAGLYGISQLLFGPGDEVILPRPYWVSYPTQVKLAGAEPVFVPGGAKNHYLPEPEEIERAITDHTKGVLINSPSNPTGGVYDREQGKKLVNLARSEDLFLISDECYDGFVYEKDLFWTLASSGYEKGLVVGSTSKNFAMTGWRLGYVLGSPDYVDPLENLQSHLTSSPPAISQKAAEAAFRADVTLEGSTRRRYRKRRNALADQLDELPGAHCSRPPGSFYVFPDVKGLLESLDKSIKTDEDFARLLLEKAGVVTVPGSAFGKPGHLRMAYLPKIKRLEEAVERIKETVGSSL